MKIELAHDVIAEKIWERLPDQDKHLKALKASIESRHYDFINRNGSYLQYNELSSWGVYISKIPLDEDTLKFWDDSKKHYRVKKNMNMLLRYSTIFILSLISLIATYYYFEAKKALNEITDRNLVSVEELILNYNYDSAWSLLILTPREYDRREMVFGAMLEPIYWKIETGDIHRSVGMLDTLANFLGNRKIKESLDSLSKSSDFEKLVILRKCIEDIDKIKSDSLRERYYPKMISVKGDTFLMGNLDHKFNSPINKGLSHPAHEVIIDDYKIAETETTGWQWKLFKSFSKKGEDKINVLGNYPVQVSWGDAREYTDWLDARSFIPEENGSRNIYRLPTEAEWEFAARERKLSDYPLYSGSDNLDSIAWYSNNSDKKCQPCKHWKPNALGLYDMTGNVSEWCFDEAFDSTSNTSYYKICIENLITKNPICWKLGNSALRVFRGGDYKLSDFSLRLRTTFSNAAYISNEYGFRVAFGCEVLPKNLAVE